jgi:exosome complex component MTR3
MHQNLLVQSLPSLIMAETYKPLTTKQRDAFLAATKADSYSNLSLSSDSLRWSSHRSTADNSNISAQNLTPRPLSMNVGVVSAAVGSSYLESNNTKLICSIYGPRQSKKSAYSDKGRLTVEWKFSAFAKHQRRPARRTGAEERQLTLQLTDILSTGIQLEQYPKSLFELFIQVIEDDNNVLNYAVIAASLAIADAGIICYDLITSVTLDFIPRNKFSTSTTQNPSSQGELIADANNSEHSHSAASFSIAYLPSIQQLSHIEQLGDLPPSISFEFMLQASIKAATAIYQQMKLALKQAAQRKLEENQTQAQAAVVLRK